MPVVKIISTLLTLLMLPVVQGQSVIVHIPTSDAIDLARMIARDEGYDVSDTKVFSFDLLMTKDGKPLLEGYTNIGFYINGDPRNTISINNMTGQAVDMFSCEVFDYPELRPFQEDMTRLSKAKRRTAQQLADDVECNSPKVLTNPVPLAKR